MDSALEMLKRFRLMAVRMALALTGLASLLGFGYNPVLGKAILAGGIAGILSFWILARQTEKLAGQETEDGSQSVLK